jgi:GTP-binding protein
MKFIDEARIEVIAGDGGNGIVSFRREKFIRGAGPTAATAVAAAASGRWPIATSTPWSTTATRASTWRATAKRGRGSDMYGAGADDIVLRMPVGTEIYDEETGALLCRPGRARPEGRCSPRAGEGGLGNIHFKSSTNRAPRQSTPGQEGEHRA